jgi:NADH-quinone oxidoreductase subunit N
MSPGDVQALLPMIVVALTAVAVVLTISFRRNHKLALWTTLAGLAIAFAVLLSRAGVASVDAGWILVMDQYAKYFMGLILVLSAVVSLFTYRSFRRIEDHKEELYVLILISALGGMVLAASNHFISFFLGLEILTVPLYVMISFLRRDSMALEAGFKYLILAAAASAFLVLGMALIYADLGQLSFGALATSLVPQFSYGSLYVLLGTGLIVVGVGFKLGVVPFHMWTPDVYQGAPAPVTAFIASVSKSAMVAVLIRYAVNADVNVTPFLFYVIGIIALLSMLLGNILAIIQTNLKRLLAYSSIAHLGYVLVGIVAVGSRATEAVLYYMTVYAITIVGAFGLISAMSGADDEAAEIESYQGLFWRRPWTAGLLAVFLFSLAGIPLTAGFIGKYFVVVAGVGSALWTLVIVLIVSSVIGLYYYLRVIAVMIGNGGTESERGLPFHTSAGSTVLLFVLGLAVIYLGVYPGPLVDLIRGAIVNSLM